MADLNSVRQQLASVAGTGSSGGSHKDQADRYRAILESIVNGPPGDLCESLQALIDQSKQ